ncbi:MAG: hypothetical protein JNM14_12955 [Ferruginibacter sp.]|nr:hypothetical protein [Ferruginibacter sp.]
MKQLFFILGCLFISSLATAQKNFEGSVTYRLHSTQGEKPDAELKVFFGKMKLKLLFKERDEYDKEALVINFDSAAVYNVNFEEKKFRKNTLTLTAPAQKPEKKLINGYSTTPLQPENTGLSGLLGSMLGTSSVVFYLADSLHYYIPAAFSGNKELLMIQRNKIVLGADIQIVNPFSDMGDSSAKRPNLVIVEAIEIKPMIMNENEFFIPVDFVNRNDIPDVLPADTMAIATDSTVAVVDTVAVPPKKIVKKKPAKSPSPKPKSSTKAVARKDT